MKKLIARLLIFFLGIPLVLAVVIADAYQHLVMHVLLIVVTIVSAHEMYNIMNASIRMQPKAAVVAVTTALPVTGLVCALYDFAFEYVTYMMIVAILFLVVLEVIFPPRGETDKLFEKSNARLGASLFTMIYAGYIITFLSRMTIWKNSVVFITVFLVMVFFCDSFAWFFGHLLGKGNRGVFAASKNKSIAGFTGGIAMSIVVGITARHFFYGVFEGHIIKAVCLGFFTACASILGDLAESVFKRSAGFKDSGRVMPGRGGMLDSIDSVLMAAPVYYIAAKLLYIL
jgi:phosphatidate cytidylyltransferase